MRINCWGDIVKKNVGTENAKKIKESLNNTLSSFYKMYNESNDEMGKQNLLRTIILFSCSGLDAIIKQLIKDCLEDVINKSEGANNQFREYVSRKIKNKDSINTFFLANVLCSVNPRKEMICSLISDLVANSLQSADEIYRIASYFDIPTKYFGEKQDELKEIFKIRNYIVHQLDVDFNSKDIKLFERKYDDAKRYSEHILQLIDKFLSFVDKILKEKNLDDNLHYIELGDLFFQPL